MDDESDADSGLKRRASARVGSVLREKWHLDRLLGLGGMAAVYEATHRNGSRAAIKMLHLEYSLEGDARRRFLREGYIANSVGHPGALRILDDDVAEDGAAFVVMELLLGETLNARAERCGGSLPPEELVGYVDALLDILASAHEQGVVHRDIKPDNVFLTQEGAVRLLDFGIARLRSARPGSLATVGESTFGTPAFMPPEQALGRSAEIDSRSDLWAVGGVMFTLLSGRAMHLGQSLNEQLVLHASVAAPPLETVAPSVPKPIQAVVDRALAFEKTKRWPSAQAMQTALREAQRQLGWPVSVSVHRSASSASPEPARGAVADSPPAKTALAVTAHGVPQGATSRKGPLLAGLIAAVVLTGGAVAIGLGFGRRPGEGLAPGRAADIAAAATATATSIPASSVPIVAPAAPLAGPSIRVEAVGSPTASARVASSLPSSSAGTPRAPAVPSAKVGSPPKPSSTPSATPAAPAPDDWLTHQH